MEISNSPVFNPAAVVVNTGKPVGGSNPEKVFEENTSRVISQATLLSFANGVPKLSTESAEAIASGALPPELAVPEDVQMQELKKAIDETVKLQTNQPLVDDSVIVELSNAALKIAEQQPAAPQPQLANVSSYAPSTPDAATAAFSNTVDFEA